MTFTEGNFTGNTHDIKPEMSLNLLILYWSQISLGSINWFILTSNKPKLVNKLKASVAYVLTMPSLVQIMVKAKPLSDPRPSHYLIWCWNIVNWTLGNKSKWNFNQNLYIFIDENAFENVACEMMAILSGPQCVNYISEDRIWMMFDCCFDIIISHYTYIQIHIDK